MTATPSPDDPDALRRRLYAPDATADDVARYRRALVAAEVRDEDEDEVAGPARDEDQASTDEDDALTTEVAPPLLPVRRHRRLPLILALVVLATGAAVALALITRPAPPVPTAPQEVLTVPASARTAFADRLASGRPADLRDWFLHHPGTRPTALNGVTRVDSTEYRHRGPGAVDLDPSSLAQRGGHVTLVLVADRDAEVRWVLDRDALREDSRGLRQVIAASPTSLSAGVPVSSSARYVSAPLRLTVTGPADVAWGAVVVFTD